MKEFVVYTAARFGLFFLCYGVVIGVYLLAVGGPPPILWPLLLAAILSTLAATILLRDLRDRFAQRVNERAHRMSQRFEEMRAREDAE